MDATELLTHDHDTVRTLGEEFKAAKETGDLGTMRKLAERICDELTVHAAIEEAVFYPAVRELAVEELTELVGESLEEHHVVKILVREIGSLAESSTDKLGAKTTVLLENVEHHASEEESELFPEVRERMSPDELATLGSALEQAKRDVRQAA